MFRISFDSSHLLREGVKEIMETDRIDDVDIGLALLAAVTMAGVKTIEHTQRNSYTCTLYLHALW